jgi:hypothetical protein
MSGRRFTVFNPKLLYFLREKHFLLSDERAELGDRKQSQSTTKGKAEPGRADKVPIENELTAIDRTRDRKQKHRRGDPNKQIPEF